MIIFHLLFLKTAQVPKRDTISVLRDDMERMKDCNQSKTVLLQMKELMSEAGRKVTSEQL